MLFFLPQHSYIISSQNRLCCPGISSEYSTQTYKMAHSLCSVLFLYMDSFYPAFLCNALFPLQNVLIWGDLSRKWHNSISVICWSVLVYVSMPGLSVPRDPWQEDLYFLFLFCLCLCLSQPLQYKLTHSRLRASGQFLGLAHLKWLCMTLKQDKIIWHKRLCVYDRKVLIYWGDTSIYGYCKNIVKNPYTQISLDALKLLLFNALCHRFGIFTLMMIFFLTVDSNKIPGRKL